MKTRQNSAIDLIDLKSDYNILYFWFSVRYLVVFHEIFNQDHSCRFYEILHQDQNKSKVQIS